MLGDRGLDVAGEVAPDTPRGLARGGLLLTPRLVGGRGRPVLIAELLDLVLRSAASNRSKAGQDPSTWLPLAANYRCEYVTDWVADKTRLGLSIDAIEQEALERTLSGCADVSITVSLAW
ncbi:hypothetical protein ABZ484_20360 [Streptomyces sp. NPDC006393]|uniref:hypothetical protein n=1 Tax=Streptomyces sp. NPDC006393 TaxID=3156763 RepID=UPI0033E87D13